MKARLGPEGFPKRDFWGSVGVSFSAPLQGTPNGCRMTPKWSQHDSKLELKWMENHSKMEVTFVEIGANIKLNFIKKVKAKTTETRRALRLKLA